MAKKPFPGHIEHFCELLESSGEVTPKWMFGGVGFFRDGLMFALEYRGTLYLKVDDDNRGDFEALDLSAFIYRTKAGKESQLPYYQAPDDAMSQPDAMRSWSESAFAVALRKKK